MFGRTSAQRFTRVSFWIAIWLLLPLGSGTAQARPFEERLTGWLNEPGVRMVAVEFYSDYCEPCKKAAPEWERLRKRYEKDGLRLVVVNIDEQDEIGKCKRLPWSPWKSMCSAQYAQEMGVTTVPQAFIWSWQGNLLLQGNGAHVEKARGVIGDYFEKNPRVMVEVLGQKGKSARQLRKRVEAELSRYDKVLLVANDAERKRLQKEQIKTFGASRKPEQQCELGQEVSANSIVEVETFEGSISLTLQQLGSTCMKTVSADYSAGRAERGVKTAVYRLMEELRHRPDMPDRAVNAPRQKRGPQAFGGETTWAPAGQQGEQYMIGFESTPPGAAVLGNGRLLCQTPCQKLFPEGSLQVEFQKPEYLPELRSLWVEGDEKVSAELEPDFGTVVFSGGPEGTELTVNGSIRSALGGEAIRLPAGSHQVKVTSPCFEETGAEFSVMRGEVLDLPLATKPRMAGIQVQTVDEKGSDLRASVEVDGAILGESPGTWTVPLCSNELIVQHGDESFAKGLELRERETLSVEAVVSKRLEETSPDIMREPDSSVDTPPRVVSRITAVPDWVRSPNQPSYYVPMAMSSAALAALKAAVVGWEAVVPRFPSTKAFIWHAQARLEEAQYVNELVNYTELLEASLTEGLEPPKAPSQNEGYFLEEAAAHMEFKEPFIDSATLLLLGRHMVLDGASRQSASRVKEAISRLRTAERTALAPFAKGNFWLAIGDAYIYLEEWDKAQSAYREADQSALLPHQKEYRILRLAWTHFALGEKGDALRLLEERGPGMFSTPLTKATFKASLQWVKRH